MPTGAVKLLASSDWVYRVSDIESPNTNIYEDYDLDNLAAGVYVVDEDNEDFDLTFSVPDSGKVMFELSGHIFHNANVYAGLVDGSQIYTVLSYLGTQSFPKPVFRGTITGLSGTTKTLKLGFFAESSNSFFYIERRAELWDVGPTGFDPAIVEDGVYIRVYEG
jgi:hypothetical protein